MQQFGGGDVERGREALERLRLRLSVRWTSVVDQANVTYMASFAGDINDIGVDDRLYALGESQGGYLTARQAIDAGVARSTLTYHAREGGMLQRVGRGVYRLRRRRFPDRS